MNKKHILSACLLAAALLGCGVGGDAASYQSITPQEARERMARPEVVVVDVREPDEYRAGHVPGARLLPLGTINEETAAAVIPDKNTEVLVYCRGGVRSKKGAQKLADLGYENVSEFGGLMQWPYEVER